MDIDKTKDDMLKIVYSYLLYCEDENIDRHEPEGKQRVEELFNLHKNGEKSLEKYISKFDKNKALRQLTTLLFDCFGDEESVFLLMVLKENLPLEMYVKILEHKYLGLHDT